MKYRIGVLEGDDIGKEVVPVAVAVFQKAVEVCQNIEVEWHHLPVGMSAYERTGSTLPEETVAELDKLDGWFLGPIGHMAYPKDDPKAINPHPILRRHFDLVSNIRPAKSFTFLNSIHQGVDLVIVRENNEGFQPDRNVYKGCSEFMPNPDLALSMRVISRRNSEFVAKTAFELARLRNGGKRVTAIHKNTVFKYGCGLFLEACQDIAATYPDISFDHRVVDTFSMQLVMQPQEFDVVVTTNMFGDILSDEASGVVGGLGMAPGLCVGPEHCMAQATHGSAPDIAGQNVANPYAMIMSGQMMAALLGAKNNDPFMVRVAELIETGVQQALAANDCLTPDLGGKASTDQMGVAICSKIGQFL